MKQLSIIFLIIATSISLYGCAPINHDGHQYITIVNRSDRKISVQQIHSSKISPADTLWACGIPALPIEANSSRMFESPDAIRGKKWEDDFKYIPFIQFLVFDDEVYVSMRDYVPCEEVDYTIPVVHYYQLKLEDLQRMDWTVVYPPYEE